MTTKTDCPPDELDRDSLEEEAAVCYLSEGMAPLLYIPPEEEGANDNELLVGMVPGAVWRERDSLQEAQGEPEAGDVGAAPPRADLPRELDFSEPGFRRRGFLDEA